MGGAGKAAAAAAAARNGRSASVCLMLVLVLGILAGQSTALWPCMKHCLSHCIGFPISSVFCASRCLVECHPDNYFFDCSEEYYCKLGCVTHDKCSNIIHPTTTTSQNHAAGDHEEKIEGYCHSCVNDCETKKH